MWQDYVLTIGFILFAIALIPMVVGNIKPALSTGLLTSFVLFTQIFIFITLGLWLSVILTAVNCGLWTTLTIQRWRQI